MNFPKLIESYIIIEKLAGNVQYYDKNENFYVVNIDNDILSNKKIIVYPDKIEINFGAKYALYAWKVFAPYNHTFKRMYKIFKLTIVENEKTMYEILSNIHHILNKIKEKHDKANRDIEQNIRK